MISATPEKDKEESFPIPQQISKSPLRSFPRNTLSLDQEKLYSKSIYRPLYVESLSKKDAKTWRWSSSIYFNRNDVRLRRLAKLIKASQKIQEIDIVFTECSRMSECQLSYISQSLKMCFTLKKLRLSFQECPQITDEGLRSLCRGLERKSHELSNFSLGLTKSQITDKGIRGLSNCLKRFPGLKELELNFGECKEISDSALRILGNRLKNMRQLLHLNLSLNSCTKITSEGLQIFSERLQRLKFSLRSLSLDFSYLAGVTDEGLQFTGEFLIKLTLLERIDLRFKRCSMNTERSLQCIGQWLCNLTSLKEISLDFSYLAPFVNPDLNTLKRTLKGLKALEVFRIDISSSGMSDTGLCFLEETGGNLKELDINLSFCSLITDTGLQNLTNKGLRKLVSLRLLSLQFQPCPHFTDAGLEIFSEGLKNLVLLRNLHIKFHTCPKITDKGFISLCEALKKLVLLESLELNFSECPQITYQGGSKLCRIVGNLSSCLKRLNWNFSKCDLFGDKEIYVLLKNLKNCKWLEKVKTIYGRDRTIMYYDDQQTLSWALNFTTERLEKNGFVYHEQEEEVLDNVENVGDEKSKQKVAEEERRQEGEPRKREKKRKAACGFNLFHMLFGCFTKKSAAGMRRNQL